MATCLRNSDIFELREDCPSSLVNRLANRPYWPVNYTNQSACLVS
jgi:hypothetical protein